jgi:hypothetical protein
MPSVAQPPPGHSDDVSAAIKKDMPPGASLLLQRRRAKVRELESAATAKQLELKQNLGDVLHHASLGTRKAGADLQEKKQRLDIAEFAVMEYAGGTYPQERDAILGEIKLAESELARAEDRVKMTDKAYKNGNVSKAQKVSEELKLQLAKFNLEQARNKLSVMENFTKAKTIKELRRDVEKARVEVRSKRSELELAMAREKQLMERSGRLNSRLTDAHIAALLTEAASLQANVVDLLAGAQSPEKPCGPAPDTDMLRAEKVEEAIAQARRIEDTARSRLAEALDLARLVQSCRDELRDAEARLRKARGDLDRLERVILEPGNPPAQSPNPTSAAAKNKIPPGGHVLLQRRRAEVSELEAAWAAELKELEQHLADFLADGKRELAKAEAEYQDFRLKREVAEIAVKEYQEGIYLQDKATIQGEIKLAEAKLVRDGDRLDSTKRARAVGNVSEVQVVSEEMGFARARFALGQLQDRLDVLENSTKPKRLQDLRADVEKSQVEERSKQIGLELARAREKQLAERSGRLNSRLAESRIAELLTEAASLQANLVGLFRSVQQAEKAKKEDTEQARKLIDQARDHEKAARSRLSEALDLARLVQSWREELRDAEARLRKTREDLERLERLMHEQ